jgi:hypothetical protein
MSFFGIRLKNKRNHLKTIAMYNQLPARKRNAPPLIVLGFADTD